MPREGKQIGGNWSSNEIFTFTSGDYKFKRSREAYRTAPKDSGENSRISINHLISLAIIPKITKTAPEPKKRNEINCNVTQTKFGFNLTVKL